MCSGIWLLKVSKRYLFEITHYQALVQALGHPALNGYRTCVPKGCSNSLTDGWIFTMYCSN